MNDGLLEKLRCPRSGNPMRRASPAELEALRGRFATGDAEPESALVDTSGALAYPVVLGIPRLLPQDAVELGAAETGGAH